MYMLFLRQSEIVLQNKRQMGYMLRYNMLTGCRLTGRYIVLYDSTNRRSKQAKGLHSRACVRLSQQQWQKVLIVWLAHSDESESCTLLWMNATPVWFVNIYILRTKLAGFVKQIIRKTRTYAQLVSRYANIITDTTNTSTLPCATNIICPMEEWVGLLSRASRSEIAAV